MMVMKVYVLVVKGTGEKDCDRDDCLGRRVREIAQILEMNPDSLPDVTPVHGEIVHFKPPDDTYYTEIKFFMEPGQHPDGRPIEPHPLLDNKDEIKKRLEANGYKIIEEYYKE